MQIENCITYLNDYEPKSYFASMIVIFLIWLSVIAYGFPFVLFSILWCIFGEFKYKKTLLKNDLKILEFDDEFKESFIKYRMIKPDWKKDAFNFILYFVSTFLTFVFMGLCYFVYAILVKFKIKLHYDVDKFCFVIPKNNKNFNQGENNAN